MPVCVYLNAKLWYWYQKEHQFIQIASGLSEQHYQTFKTFEGSLAKTLSPRFSPPVAQIVWSAILWGLVFKHLGRSAQHPARISSGIPVAAQPVLQSPDATCPPSSTEQSSPSYCSSLGVVCVVLVSFFSFKISHNKIWPTICGVLLSLLEVDRHVFCPRHFQPG